MLFGIEDDIMYALEAHMNWWDEQDKEYEENFWIDEDPPMPTTFSCIKARIRNFAKESKLTKIFTTEKVTEIAKSIIEQRERNKK